MDCRSVLCLPVWRIVTFATLCLLRCESTSCLASIIAHPQRADAGRGLSIRRLPRIDSHESARGGGAARGESRRLSKNDSRIDGKHDEPVKQDSFQAPSGVRLQGPELPRGPLETEAEQLLPPGDSASAPALGVTANRAVTRVDSASSGKGHEISAAIPSRAATELALRAEAAIERGLRLASRKAYYSSRADFIQALRIIAQALDSRAHHQVHNRALASALRALREAEDFLPRGSRVESDLDLGIYLASHRTPVLKNVDPKTLTPLAALQRYFTYAQKQFAIAGGKDPVASRALFALAKVSLEVDKNTSRAWLSGPTAMSLYQAALVIDERNVEAANELGVLMARYGQLADARRVL